MGMSAGVGQGVSSIANVVSGIFGGFNNRNVGQANANAATNAAGAQVQGAQNGLNAIQGIAGQQQGNAQPFISGGQQSLAQIMAGLSNGTFGSGSTGQAPVYGGGTFQAPTAAEAQATPGYQFTQSQGDKGILQGAAAAGGAISGGTLKSLAGYNSGLADSTYQSTFNRALSTYGAGLSQYQAQLQGYGAKLQGQQQEFGQEFAPAQLGAGVAGQYNSQLGKTGEDLANLYNNQGNANAAGIIGANNALQNGRMAGNNAFQGTANGLFGGGGGGGSSLSGILGMFGGGANNASGYNNAGGQNGLGNYGGNHTVWDPSGGGQLQPKDTWGGGPG